MGDVWDDVPYISYAYNVACISHGCNRLLVLSSISPCKVRPLMSLNKSPDLILNHLRVHTTQCTTRSLIMCSIACVGCPDSSISLACCPFLTCFIVLFSWPQSKDWPVRESQQTSNSDTDPLQCKRYPSHAKIAYYVFHRHTLFFSREFNLDNIEA
jgi:hypothetical protein